MKPSKKSIIVGVAGGWEKGDNNEIGLTDIYKVIMKRKPPIYGGKCCWYDERP